MKELVLWGARGQAKVLAELVADLGYRIVAVFDNDPGAGSPFPGVPIFHGEEGFERWRRAAVAGAGDAALPAALVAIGGARGRVRHDLQRRLAYAGLTIPSVVHRRAFVAADVELGAGCQILANSSLCVEVKLGEACIVNTGASVDHETILGDGVHLAPGAVLCGCVEVGRYAMIGAGAVVLPRVSIGEEAIVGAGAVVTENVEDGATVVGAPARPTNVQHERMPPT